MHWWLTLAWFPFPGGLALVVIMPALMMVSDALERRRGRQYDPGLPVPVTVSRTGYRGRAWYVEDGRAYAENDAP